MNKYETINGDTSFVFKFHRREMTFDEPVYLEIITSEVLTLQMCELYYVIQQHYNSEDNLVILYIYTKFFVYNRKPKTSSMFGDLTDSQKN